MKIKNCLQKKLGKLFADLAPPPAPHWPWAGSTPPVPIFTHPPPAKHFDSSEEQAAHEIVCRFFRGEISHSEMLEAIRAQNVRLGQRSTYSEGVQVEHEPVPPSVLQLSLKIARNIAEEIAQTPGGGSLLSRQNNMRRLHQLLIALEPLRNDDPKVADVCDYIERVLARITKSQAPQRRLRRSTAVTPPRPLPPYAFADEYPYRNAQLPPPKQSQYGSRMMLIPGKTEIRGKYPTAVPSVPTRLDAQPAKIADQPTYWDGVGRVEMDNYKDADEYLIGPTEPGTKKKSPMAGRDEFVLNPKWYQEK